MSQSLIRTSFDRVMVYTVSAPANTGAAKSIASLLATADAAEMVGWTVLRAEVYSPTTALLYKHGSPLATGSLSTGTAGMVIKSGTKPNEVIEAADAANNIYLVSSTTLAVSDVVVKLCCVNSLGV